MAISQAELLLLKKYSGQQVQFPPEITPKALRNAEARLRIAGLVIGEGDKTTIADHAKDLITHR